MNLFDAIAKIESSEEFKRFISETPAAYFCAAFFILDFETNDEKRQLDYFISAENVMTFSLVGEEVKAAKAELPKKEKIPEIDYSKIKLDENQAIETAKKESEIGDFTKIIAVLQKLEGKEIWNLSCIKGLQMMRYHVSAEDGKVLKKEKINLMDMMKIEPGKTPDYIQ